jgi:hypothetical protein
MPLDKRQTIAIDFDGVIHAYTKGWHDGTAYDPPMKDAIKYIKMLMEEFTVYVFSTRDPAQIQDWFGRYGEQIPTQIIDSEQTFWATVGVLGIARHKVVAYVWLDDRALRFEGKWERAYMSIKNLIDGKPIAHSGKTSDGYHTFNELYRHRYVLFVGMARAYYVACKDATPEATEAHLKQIIWCSKLHHDGTMFDDSFIVGMSLSVGQVSYHLPIREWERVSKLLPVVDRAPEWDGHTPADVLDRLERWVYGPRP